MTQRIKGKLIQSIPSWTGTIKAIRKSRTALDAFEDESLISIEEKIRRRWTSSYHELSLALDVSHVLAGLKVMHQDKIMFEGNKKEPRAAQMVKFIMAILYQIETDSFLTSKTREELEEILNSVDGALHERLHTFILDGTYNPKLIDVLKCLSTDIFAPASHDLKTAIQEKYTFLPMEDKQRGVFRLDYPNVEVNLSHSEGSVDDSAGQHFHFTWETKISMNLVEGVKSLKAKVNISGFEFDESMKAATKRDLRELFEPFIDENGAYVILWQRNLLRVPVHKDLVRLSKNLVIVDSNNQVLFNDPQQTLSGVVSVTEILRVLATALNDKVVIEACDHISEFVKDQGDLSEQLIKFFQLPAFSEEGPVVKILKCISQEMIYPAVQTIRNMLYEKHPYKDVKGGWGVRVVLDPGCVSVTHTKKEQSHEENGFEFTWKLKLLFDPKMETIYPTLNIVDFEWGDNLSESAKVDVMNLTYSLIDADALYNEISQKTFGQVPVAKDMVEIAKSEGFEVHNQKEDDAPIFRTSKTFDLRKNISDFIVTLSEAVDGKVVSEGIAKRMKKFVDHVPSAKIALEESLHQMLIGEAIPSESNTMKVIRCLRADVIAPGHRKLRRVFPQNMPMGTISGSWLVRVIVQHERIMVQHSRRERGSDGDLVGVFEFRWVQSFLFDPSMEHAGTDLKIVDYSWDANIREETKQTLRRLWAPFVEWHGTSQQLDTSRFTYLSANDILKCVTATLERQPEHLIPPHLVEQLKALNDTISTVFVPLVVLQDNDQ